jgi:hypothetical protein
MYQDILASNHLVCRIPLAKCQVPQNIVVAGTRLCLVSALILRYAEGLRYAKMAAALGVSISGVRSLLTRAKRTLRRELADSKKNLLADRNFLARRVY